MGYSLQISGHHAHTLTPTVISPPYLGDWQCDSPLCSIFTVTDTLRNWIPVSIPPTTPIHKVYLYWCLLEVTIQFQLELVTRAEAGALQ